jgi:hypothetical protein
MQSQKEEVVKERDQLRENLKVAVDALEFYRTWENQTETAWIKTYNRNVLSVDYPGPSKARDANTEDPR